ncbi:F-box/kelch-repeat protein At3g23880-like [Nicotiana tomentosiformis]|uniref:F-box/kelch-repeat protein At3g23880-like n=1 Tax=Nicotiana tomentosiformis TaxID=4098 RepID=UPI00388C9351
MEFSEEAAATSSIANLSNDSESVLPSSIHQNPSKFSTKKQDLRLLFSGSPENNRHRFYTCSLYAIMYQESLHQPIELDLSCKDYHKVEGSCDGLLCLSVGHEELYLWNPSIQKLKRLAWSGNNNLHYTTYGFGYNESQDDYKLVKVDGSCRAYGFRGFEHLNNVSIYSLRTNSWKSILEKFPGVFFCRDPAKFVNGKLHWIATHRRDNIGPWFIVSLNLINLTSEEVALSLYVDDGNIKWKLGTLGGNLCLFCDCNKVQMNVWNALKHSEIQIHDDSGVQFNLYIESLVSPNFVEEV